MYSRNHICREALYSEYLIISENHMTVIPKVQNQHLLSKAAIVQISCRPYFDALDPVLNL